MSEVVLLFNLVLKLTPVETPAEFTPMLRGLDTLKDCKKASHHIF